MAEEQPVGNVEYVDTNSQQQEEVLNDPKPSHKEDIIGDIFNTDNLSRKMNRLLNKADQAFDVSPVFVCLLATAGSIMGALFVYIVKRNVLIARQYAMQSIIVNGLTLYACLLVGISTIFSHSLLWLFVIAVLINLFLYAIQIALVLLAQGNKFIGLPLLGGWIAKQHQPSTLLPN